MRKGIIGLLLGGGLIGIIVLIVVAVIAWMLTNWFCILCEILGKPLDAWHPGWGPLAWWIQFFIILLVLRKITSGVGL